MKFLFTSSYYSLVEPVAIEMHIKRLAGELVRRGHEVHVLYSLDANNYKKYQMIADGERSCKDGDGVWVHPVRSTLGALEPYITYTIGRSHAIEDGFRSAVRSIQPDVVHHHNLSFLGHTVLHKHADYLSVFTPHDYWLICTRMDLFKTGKSLCERKSCLWCGLRSITSLRPPQLWRAASSYRHSLEQVDIILAPTRFMMNRLGQELGNRLELLPFFAVPPTQIKETQRDNYFLFAGVLGRHKGILDLLEAFRCQRQQIAGNLIIAGKGPLAKDIKSFIMSNRLQDRIEFLGWVSLDMLWSLYKNALAVVVPSIWPENCPAVALEALAAGTPVIGSDQGGLPDIICKVDRELMFKAGNIEQLAERLVNFDRSKYPPQRLREVHEEWYAVDAYVDKYETIIDGSARRQEIGA